MSVSVIIPTYNNAEYVPKALDSIIYQKYYNIEIIIIDDGSTDNTRYVIENYKFNFENKKKLFTNIQIKYYYNNNNEGAASARNLGICKSNSEFIGFLDADDTYLQGMISECIKKLNHGNYDLVSVDNYKVYYDGDKEIGREIENYEWIEIDSEALFCKFLKIGAIGGIHKAFFRRSVFENIGLLDTTLKVYEDLDLWIRVARHGLKWGHIRKPLLEYNYRGSGTSLFTHSKKRNMDHRLTILKRNKNYAIKKCPYFYKDYADLLWNFGRSYILQHNNILKGIKCCTESFIIDPDFKRVINSLKTRIIAMKAK